MLPDILEIVVFRSNNDAHRPVIKALEVVRQFMDSPAKYLELDGSVPIDGIMGPGRKKSIIQKDGNGNRVVEKMEYEICVLQAEGKTQVQGNMGGGSGQVSKSRGGPATGF